MRISKKKFNTKFLVFPFLLISILFNACKSECDYADAGKFVRKKFTEDDLSWVKYPDSVVSFKYKIEEKEGIVEGKYDNTYRLEKWKLVGPCREINFSEVYSSLILPDSIYPLKTLITSELTNYDSEQIVLKTYGNNNLYILGDVTDTALVNGKIYSDVLKFKNGKDIYYLSKGNGYIKIKIYSNLADMYKWEFELIPK